MNELYVYKQEKQKYDAQLQIEQDEYARKKLTNDFYEKQKGI
jgi:hypothetical protein